MPSALPTASAATTSATPSTSAWLFLAGMLSCLLVIGHQLPFAHAPEPTQRVAAPRQVAAPVLGRQYATTRAVATASAAL